MTVSEGGATCCDCGVHPGLVHGDHVGVALDDHGLALASHRLTGSVHSEQDPGFVIDDRICRVHIFGVGIIRLLTINPSNKTPTETHGITPDIMDWKHQPASENVIETVSASSRQTSVRHRSVVGPTGLQAFGERVPVGAGKSNSPLVNNLDLIATVPQIGTSWTCLRRLLETGVIDVDGASDGLHRRLLSAPLLGRIGVDDKLDACLAGEDVERIGKVDTLSLLNKLEDVTAFATAEAVIEPLTTVDRH